MIDIDRYIYTYIHIPTCRPYAGSLKKSNEQTLNSISSEICIVFLLLPAPFWILEVGIIGFLSNFPHYYASFPHKFSNSLNMVNDAFAAGAVTWSGPRS